MPSVVTTYEQISRQQWSALVRTSRTGTWFQSPEAYDFYASMPELFAPFVIGVTDGHDGAHAALRAICVGYVTKERNAVRQYFTRRAIIIGGPVLADDCTEDEVRMLMTDVREHLSCSKPAKAGAVSSPIYIETRNFNDYGRWKNAFLQAGFRYMPHLNYHFDCTEAEPMWRRLSETRRRQIRKAQSCGVAVDDVRRNADPAEAEKGIREFYMILSDLYRKKVRTPLFPLAFFTEFYRQGRGTYLLVKHEGKVLGGMMCPVMDGQCIYEWFVCGLDAEYRDLYPSVTATWAAMVYAHAHGIPKFDIMGAGEPGVPYGVRDFKAEFGGAQVEHGRFLYVAKPLLYKIGKTGVRILKSGR